jgi:hypothetical protein
VNGLCRDCATPETGDGEPARLSGRCRNCGSTRMVRHRELGALAIAHLDCDAFYASVEKRDNPGLADRPVIVGGGSRGVVTTCCYVARLYGVRSAMPMFKALKACPDAVVIPPDMAKYRIVGRQVRALMREATPLVEAVSIDEAFLDLSGTESVHGGAPARTLALLAERIERNIGITVSIGLSYNKFLAKVASDLDKPRGFAMIGRRCRGVPARQAGGAHLGRRPCLGTALGKRWHHPDRSAAGHQGERACRTIRRHRPSLVALCARRGRAPRRRRRADQEHLGGDHLRARPQRAGRHRPRDVAALRDGRTASAQRRSFGGRRRAQAQDGGFQVAHPGAPSCRSDPACRHALPHRAHPARTRDRRRRLSACRRRRREPGRGSSKEPSAGQRGSRRRSTRSGRGWAAAPLPAGAATAGATRSRTISNSVSARPRSRRAWP